MMLRSRGLPMEEKLIRRSQHFKQTTSLNDRLLLLAREAENRAAKMPPCEQRDNLLRKARTAKTTAELELLFSPIVRRNTTPAGRPRGRPTKTPYPGEQAKSRI